MNATIKRGVEKNMIKVTLATLKAWHAAGISITIVRKYENGVIVRVH